MSDYNAVLSQLISDVARQTLENSHRTSGTTGGSRPKESWLAKMVEALNTLIEGAFKDMIADSKAVSKSNPKTMTDFQVSSQIFSLLMNTAQTVVKTVGEANANAARKQ